MCLMMQMESQHDMKITHDVFVWREIQLLTLQLYWSFITNMSST